MTTQPDLAIMCMRVTTLRDMGGPIAKGDHRECSKCFEPVWLSHSTLAGMERVHPGKPYTIQCQVCARPHINPDGSNLRVSDEVKADASRELAKWTVEKTLGWKFKE